MMATAFAPAVKQPLVSLNCRRVQPRRSVRVAAVQGLYNERNPDPAFVEAVLDAFPEAAVANAEEARVLYTHGGYTWLDIRSKMDVDRFGMVRNAVHVPYTIAKKRFVDGKMVVDTTPNDAFLEEMEEIFPKDAKLLVGDINGKDCAIDALGDLDDAGYENIVGIKGGYIAWFKVWDNKLVRRNLGEFVEDPYGEGGPSCGVHASGAGFEKMDGQSQDFWNSM